MGGWVAFFNISTLEENIFSFFARCRLLVRGDKVEMIHSVGREVNQRNFADLVASAVVGRTRAQSRDNLSSVSVDQPEV